MEKKQKKVQLYCFIYEIKENQVYRQDHEAELYDDSYFIHDEDDETIFVQGWKIDTPQTSGMEDDAFIYMYSLNKDVHRALELIHKTLERTLNELKNKVEWYENFIKTFVEKQEYIKNKYPNEEND